MMVDVLTRLKQGQRVKVPVYDFVTHSRFLFFIFIFFFGHKIYFTFKVVHSKQPCMGLILFYLKEFWHFMIKDFWI